MQFTAACIQLNTQDDLIGNLAAIDTLVQEAADKGAEFIALPENCFVMEAPGGGFKSPAYLEDEHPGVLWAKEKAKALGVWLMIGSVALRAEGTSKRYNRLILIDNKGNIASRYDKIHLFDVTLPDGEIYAESVRIEAGNQAVLATTPWGKLGLSVCYDVRFPHLYRGLAKAGAELQAIPAAFTYTTGSAHWHVLLRARAIENGCFVIAPAQCGLHPGNRRTYGHSMIIDPWGRVLAEASEDKPGIIFAQIDTDQVHEIRQKIPSLQHNRVIL